jgi:hypothetical protein
LDVDSIVGDRGKENVRVCDVGNVTCGVEIGFDARTVCGEGYGGVGELFKLLIRGK